MSTIQPDNLTLQNIRELQRIEKELFNKLKTDRNNLTLAEKNDIVNKINELVNSRINLYKGLNTMNDAYTKNLNNSSTTLDNQVFAVKTIENQLNESKKRLQLIEEEKINKLRIVEINTFYGKKYKDQVDLLKIITYVFIVISILTVFLKVGVLPLNLYYFLFIIIVFLFFVVSFNKILKMYNRDNMNYDEFNWKFDSKKAPKPPASDASMNVDPWSIKIPHFNPYIMSCVGQECCSNETVWDSSSGLCIYNTSALPATDSSNNDMDALFGDMDTNEESEDTIEFFENYKKKKDIEIFESQGYNTQNMRPDARYSTEAVKAYNI